MKALLQSKEELNLKDIKTKYNMQLILGTYCMYTLNMMNYIVQRGPICQKILKKN